MLTAHAFTIPPNDEDGGDDDDDDNFHLYIAIWGYPVKQ